MKILVVMTNYPFPPKTGSEIVAYNSIKYLSKHHKIHFICLQPADGSTIPAEFVEQSVFVPQKSKSNISRKIQYILGMRYLLGIPYLVAAFASKAMEQKVGGLIQGDEFDAILLFEISALQYCPPSCYGKLIINIEDPQSIRLERMAKLQFLPIWQRVAKMMLAKVMARYEQRILPLVAKVILLSAADADDMSKQAGYSNLGSVSYGVRYMNENEILKYENRERVIIFSGNMYHPPNVDGALFLLKEIFPLILQGYSSAVLWIVGADPDLRIYKAAENFGKQVVITGRVDSVADYIGRATVSICPVRLKIGVQTKVLEALSLGTPVVTTSAGNSGIRGLSGIQLWVEDDPRLLAKRVVELLRGHGWLKLSEEGKKFTDKLFSWEVSGAQLEEHLKSLV